MGVHGLWKILEPTANPVKLDTLRGKILAIDASIWIYHFLKAMRDPKGTVLTAAHIIGFFRRICKLMFFEIRPVFVFDGAAPVLKKKTTSQRQERRIGREQNARATANKLLTLQLQKLAAESSSSGKNDSQNANPQIRGNVEVVGSVPKDARYLDEVRSKEDGENMPVAAPNDATRAFFKTDQYHLPNIENIGPIRTDDQRMLTQDELDEYSRHFTSQARTGFIDTSLVDFHSSEFQQLPIETQYQLLNMARLKSRLRMGYTAEELNKMFPNEMEFSKFQINRVAQRNFFTQKLMHLVGLEDDLTRRVSSEKNKEYYLKRTDQGWSLSLEEGTPDPNTTTKPAIKPTSDAQPVQLETSENEEEDSDFEDVDLSAASDIDEKPQTSENTSEVDHIDLTTEESAKIDELFGFEAGLSRQDLYSKLIDEVLEEEGHEEEGRAEAQRPSKTESGPGRSLLFGNAPNKPEPAQEKANKEAAPAVPWFGNADHGFEEMKIREREDLAHLVPVDADFLSESDTESQISMNDTVPERPVVSDSEPITSTDSADPASKPDVKQTPEPDTEEVTNSTFKPTEEPTQAATQVVTREAATKPTTESSTKAPGDEATNATIGPTAKISGEVATPDPETLRLPESDISAPRSYDIDATPGKPQSSGEAEISDAEIEEPHLVEHDQQNLEVAGKDTTERVEGAEEGEQKETADIIPEGDGETELEPRVELSQDAAERAEQEAEEEKEEDEDIAGMLIAEAEENERFARELANQSKGRWTDEDQRDYESQINDLRKQFGHQSRDADNVSTEMIQECQELLQLFGIPYITAPAEAEAQCAELRQLKLVDGVVTDDGDTFLFDTNAVVYRNMFNQAKFVEFYTMKQIEQRLGLSREGLIDLAFLLGSDYTEGVLGIGPVTGVEILAEFGTLANFAQWWREAQRFPDAVGTETTLKRRLLRQFKSKLFLPEDFPSPQIRDAYLHPAVDKDATRFNWGAPDLDGLRKFMAAVAGWDIDKTNAALLPVVQEAKRRDLLRKTEAAYDQMRLDDYYQTVVQNPAVGSKRAAKAASAMRKKRPGPQQDSR